MMIIAATFFTFQVLLVSADHRALRPIFNQKEPCTLVRLSTGKWHCELSDLDTSVTGNRFVEIEGLEEVDLNENGVRSGVSSLLVADGTISYGKLIIPPGVSKSFGRVEQRGSAAQIEEKETGGRHLSSGNSSQRVVLAVRVLSPDSAASSTVPQIRNFVFGVSGDVVNLKERFESCSFGEVLVIPYNGTTLGGRAVARGGYQVSIGTKAIGSEVTTIVNAAIERLSALLGDLPSQFDHVLLCLPSGVLSAGSPWNASAYLGHWLSWYNDHICNDAGHQFREVGYNLGLYHSSELWEVNGDATCTMGSGREKTCFNAAKSSQLHWYSQRKIDLNFKERGGFNGKLIGANDYQHVLSDGKYVYVKVDASRYVFADLFVFVGFNLAAGIHADTGEAQNLVTVHVQEKSWESYLVAKLAAGDTHTMPGYLGGLTLNVRVNSITLSASPPVADVDVFLTGCPPGVCGRDCNACCVDTDCPAKFCTIQSCQQGMCVYNASSCSGVFRMELMTDTYASDISWDVFDQCNGRVVLSGDSYSPNIQGISSVSTAFIGISRFMFTIRDFWGDGLPDGYFRAEYNGNIVAENGGGGVVTPFTSISMEFGGACI